jgi:hypothetical protein
VTLHHFTQSHYPTVQNCQEKKRTQGDAQVPQHQPNPTRHQPHILVQLPPNTHVTDNVSNSMQLHAAVCAHSRSSSRIVKWNVGLAILKPLQDNSSKAMDTVRVCTQCLGMLSASVLLCVYHNHELQGKVKAMI